LLLITNVLTHRIPQNVIVYNEYTTCAPLFNVFSLTSRWCYNTKRGIYKPCLRVPAPVFAVLMTIIHKTDDICVNIPVTLRRVRETIVPVEKQEVVLHIDGVCL